MPAESSTSVVAETASDAPLSDLLDRLLSTFRELQRTGANEDSSVDEDEFKKEMEEFSTRLQALSDVLQEQRRTFHDLGEEVRTENGKKACLDRLESDRTLAWNMKTDLVTSRRKLQESAGVNELIYKITGSRSALGCVKNQLARKSIGQALTKSSVLQEKLSQTQKALSETLDELGRRGIDEKLLTRLAPELPPTQEPVDAEACDNLEEMALRMADSSDRSADAALKAETKQRRVEKTPATNGRKSSTRDTQAPESGKTRDANKSESDRSKNPTASVPTSISESFHERLVEWAKWQPLAPPDVDQATHVLAADADEAVILKIQTLWAQRKPNATVDNAALRLWDLVALPPEKFQQAHKKNDQCTTDYVPQPFEVVSYAGGLPAKIVHRAKSTRVVHDEFSAHKNDRIEADLEKQCIQSSAKNIHKDDLHVQVKEFFEARAIDLDQRLVRASIEITTVPVVQLKCEYRDAKRGTVHFQAWLYGDDKALHIDNPPRVWSRKATLWLCGIGGLGVPLGLLAAKLVQTLF